MKKCVLAAFLIVSIICITIPGCDNTSTEEDPGTGGGGGGDGNGSVTVYLQNCNDTLISNVTIDGENYGDITSREEKEIKINPGTYALTWTRDGNQYAEEELIVEPCDGESYDKEFQIDFYYSHVETYCIEVIIIIIADAYIYNATESNITDVTLNGTAYGTIESDDFTEVDIDPGTYDLSWTYNGSTYTEDVTITDCLWGFWMDINGSTVNAYCEGE